MAHPVSQYMGVTPRVWTEPKQGNLRMVLIDQVVGEIIVNNVLCALWIREKLD